MTKVAAIARSISHQETVTVDYDSTLGDMLSAESEGVVVNSAYRQTEYWGTDEDGNEWRVHMRHEVEADDVTIEEMPDHHRGSHRAAGNWGSYPHNGATRREVSREEADEIVADEIVAADPDSYAHIVD
jgi:hypothetical protein